MKTVTTFIEFFKANNYEFKIKLNYEDSFGNIYKELIIVDLTHIEEQEHIKTKNFNDLVQSVDNLTKTINKE